MEAPSARRCFAWHPRTPLRVGAGPSSPRQQLSSKSLGQGSVTAAPPMSSVAFPRARQHLARALARAAAISADCSAVRRPSQELAQDGQEAAADARLRPSIGGGS